MSALAHAVRPRRRSPSPRAVNAADMASGPVRPAQMRALPSRGRNHAVPKRRESANVTEPPPSMPITARV